jgi:hypothetical protein
MVSITAMLPSQTGPVPADDVFYGGLQNPARELLWDIVPDASKIFFSIEIIEEWLNFAADC